MPLFPNIDDLLAKRQASHADAIDLTETLVNAIIDGGVDLLGLNTLRRRIGEAPQHALASTVTLQAGLLACAAVELAEHTGQIPEDILAGWRRSAAQAVNLTETQLTGESP
jgi:hypothetical protein